MRSVVSAYLDRFLHDRRARLRLGGVILLLAILVTGLVFWRLHYTGIAMTNEVYCGQEEHVHDDSCYEWVLTCGMEESEGTAGHTHSAECYETVTTLVCGLEESEGHIHDDSCFDEYGNLICAIPESEGHTHSDSCYETTQVLVCGLEESEAVAGHTHTDACYTQVLTCAIPEHVHSMACMIDETADLETADDWEATLPDAEEELTGVWREDIVLIAESQIGYTESERNFALADGNTRNGYTRYGEWYGNPYGNWDTMFASFSLYYAGVTEETLPYNAGAYAWAVELAELAEKEEIDEPIYVSAEDHTPVAGDIVFLDTDGDEDSKPDTVAIVAELILPDEMDIDQTVMLRLIQGDSNDAVEEYEIELEDGSIVGYAVIPEQPAEEGNIIMPSGSAVTNEDAIDSASVTGDGLVAGTPGTASESADNDLSSDEIDEDGSGASDELEDAASDEPASGEIDDDDSASGEASDEASGEASEEASGEASDEASGEMELTTLTYEGEDFTITVTYGPEAELPEGVELIAFEYDQDSEIYAQRYAEAAELYGWDTENTGDADAEDVTALPDDNEDTEGSVAEDTDAEDGADVYDDSENAEGSVAGDRGDTDVSYAGDSDIRLFNIGLYVVDEDGEMTEVEPAAAVEVTITYHGQEERSFYTVAHFGEDEAEDVEIDSAYEDGEETLEFALDGFSDIMVLAYNTTHNVVFSWSNENNLATGWGGHDLYTGGYNGGSRTEIDLSSYADNNGNVTITLPRDSDLTDGNVYTLCSRQNGPTAQNAQITLSSISDYYDYELVGWYDLYDGSYYAPGERVEINVTNEQHVFYADYYAASYDAVPDTSNWDEDENGDQIATGTTAQQSMSTEFVTVELFDYNELLNLYSTTVTYEDGGWEESHWTDDDGGQAGWDGLENSGEVFRDADWFYTTPASFSNTRDTNTAATGNLAANVTRSDTEDRTSIHSFTFKYNEIARADSESEETRGSSTTTDSEGVTSVITHYQSGILYPYGLNDWNEWSGSYNLKDAAEVWDMATDEDNVLLDYLFNERSTAIGVNYVGTADYLFQYGTEDDANADKWTEEGWDFTGYYYYSSELNAAAYNQSDERFYLYTGTEVNRTDGTYSMFLPFNNYENYQDRDTSVVPASQDLDVNYYFGMKMEVEFYLPNAVDNPNNVGVDVDVSSNKNWESQYTETDGNVAADGDDMVFNFSGDDDIMIYIDGQLVLDMSGIHYEAHGSIDFNTGIITKRNGEDGSVTGSSYTESTYISGFELGAGEHTLTVYYLERGTGLSNLTVSFNISPYWQYTTGPLQTIYAEKTWSMKGQEEDLSGWETEDAPDVTFGLFEAAPYGYEYDAGTNTYTLYRENDEKGSPTGETYTFDAGSNTLLDSDGTVFAWLATEYDENGSAVPVLYDIEAEEQKATGMNDAEYAAYLEWVAWMNTLQKLYIREDTHTMSYNDADTRIAEDGGTELSYGWWWDWELLDPEGDYIVLEINDSTAYTADVQAENIQTFYYWTIIGENEIEDMLTDEYVEYKQVGEREGNYSLQSGEYVYVGEGRGNYVREVTRVAKESGTQVGEIILTDAAQGGTANENGTVTGYVVVRDRDASGNTILRLEPVEFSQEAKITSVVTDENNHTVWTGEYGATGEKQIAPIADDAVWYVEATGETLDPDHQTTVRDISGATIHLFRLYYVNQNGTPWYLCEENIGTDTDPNWVLSFTSDVDNASLFYDDAMGELRIHTNDDEPENDYRVCIETDGNTGEKTLLLETASTSSDDQHNVKIYSWNEANSSGYIFHLTNELNPDVTLEKVDAATGKALIGAEFVLYKEIPAVDENGDPVLDEETEEQIYDKEYYQYVGSYIDETVTINVTTWEYNNPSGQKSIKVPEGQDIVLHLTLNSSWATISGYSVYDGSGGVITDLEGWALSPEDIADGVQDLSITIPADAVQDGLTIVVTGNPDLNALDVSYTVADPDHIAPVNSNEQKLTVNVYANNSLVGTYQVYTPVDINISASYGDYSVSYTTSYENESSLDENGNPTVKTEEASQSDFGEIIFYGDGTISGNGVSEGATYVGDTITLNVPVGSDGEITANYTVSGSSKGVFWVDSEEDATRVKTGTSGKVTFRYLEAGTYTIEEVTVPDGYSKLFNTLTFTIDENGNISNVYVDGQAVSVNGKNLDKDGVETTTNNSAIVSWDGNDLSITVANTNAVGLPSTGSGGYWVVVTVGLIMVVCAAIALGITGKKRKGENAV